MTRVWRFFTVSLLVLLSLSLLAGCGAKSWRKGGVPGSKPYTIRGKTYYPLKSARGFVEIGIASWYGPGFHGKKTATGERFNQYGISAAHKILPLGTKVKVTNLGNRRSLILRINDRGPFVDDRVIDLSRGAAQKLGIIGKGTGRVKIQSLDMVDGGDDAESRRQEALATMASVAPVVAAAAPVLISGMTQAGNRPAPPRQEPRGPYASSPPAGMGNGPFYIQVGAFSDKNNARALAQRLKYGGHRGRLHYGQERRWNVQVGPINSASDTDVILRLLRQQYPQAFVVGP